MLPDCFHALKLAQRDLIARCDGLDAVAERIGKSRGHVARWNNPDTDDEMPLHIVHQLEAACGVPFVTRALAGLSGRRLADVDPEDAEPGSKAEMHSAIAAIFSHQATLMANWSDAIRDNVVTPSERRIIMRDLSKIGHEIIDAQMVFAGANKAEG